MSICAASQPQTDITQAFLDFVARHDFPCVGAKTALSRGRIHFARGTDLRSSHRDHDIVQSLQAFAHAMPKAPMFVSLVVTFEATPTLTERGFEHALWRRLQAIHDIDSRTCPWDSQVSKDPAAADFALSVGSRGFFVIGLHPGASRKARRFSCPALVFNLNDQFVRLRSEHRFDKFSTIIAKRDKAFCGSVNPMLAQHGQASDAPQYSGRQVDATWRCPFQARPAQDNS